MEYAKVDNHTKLFIYRIICSLNSGDFEKESLECISDIVDNGYRVVTLKSKDLRYSYEGSQEEDKQNQKDFCKTLTEVINRDFYKYKLDCGAIEAITIKNGYYVILIPDYWFFSRLLFKYNRAMYNISGERWTYKD
ncbi:MAG: hypothetical protein ACRCZB_04915 [Bacteroidales bacterium]